jgi:hypothetical protein
MNQPELLPLKYKILDNIKKLKRELILMENALYLTGGMPDRAAEVVKELDQLNEEIARRKLAMT